MGDVRRVCFLGMPGYGHITPGAARGFHRASRWRDYDPHLSYTEGSLLAQNMNRLWCEALNLAHAGTPVAYFAMIHADIEPADCWLDDLIAEMEARDLDVLGAVAPIKDPRGVTSTAIAHPDGSPWRVRARLTMEEVYRLPPTFTSEDVGGPLLLNTGLWVCRFAEGWARECHFEVNDRVAFSPKDGRYYAEVEPEDWNFSRQLHDLGKRVGCTRKVKLGHRGGAVFTNSRPWGTDDFDTQAVPASVLPAADRDGFRFPHDVDGWLSYDEGKALWELARGKRVLEIGSYCGRSTICVGQSADSVVCVDPFDGRATGAERNTFKEFVANVRRYGAVANGVSPYTGTSGEVLPKLVGDSFDLVFIDGAHDLESVRYDIRHARRLLAPGGLLAFHDYRDAPGEVDGRWDQGVTAAVGELLAAGGELVSRHDSLAVVRPPVLEPVGV